ncbi:MAG TPA: DNRLRE domain-containing protein [Pirellulales bacterium]|nr:DNRLRE domain-containing protein [Pirellulales bacterium]
MLWQSVAYAVLLAILSFAPRALGGQVILTPAKDNTLIQRSDPGSQLSNGQGDIFVGRTNQDGQGTATISIRRGLVQFDVAGNIPAGATITSATLTMVDVMGLNGDRTVELHRVLADWGEGASFQNGGMGAASQAPDASWLYNFYNTSSWTTPGGDFSNAVSASTTLYDASAPGPIFPSGSSFSWSSATDPQMIADVQDWLDSPASNFGWLLRGDESAGKTIKRLAGGESATPPVLVINFVPEPGSFVLLAAGVLTLIAVPTAARVRKERSGAPRLHAP